VSTEKLSEDFVNEFNEVLKQGINHITEAVEEDYRPSHLSKEHTIKYLTQRIDYQLDEDKRQALALFLDYIGEL
jgi:chorismate dehydratase